ncbi:MOB kinase activator 2 isoform X3 [Grammomys surdaster]|uniref:MOB kinase activator 2 isoform X3 n=1 Tax=Grammomys surdaster TaxID=491861 RepID=UPI00109FA635|nr:MOB kinase activator 2 isoform X3 [Grammomys surdaster]
MKSAVLWRRKLTREREEKSISEKKKISYPSLQKYNCEMLKESSNKINSTRSAHRNSQRQYYWYDERGKKVKCTAPQYVDFVMSSVQKLVTDEDVFPTKYGREFPSSFESLVKKICKYLFHVLGHIYWAHFKETLALELHGHLNTLYVHFILFAREFNLLDPKETAVMDDLTEVLCSSLGNSGATGDGASSGASGAQNHVKER